MAPMSETVEATTEAPEPPDRALHASTSSSIHLMFDERRLPTTRLQPAIEPGGRMSVYIMVSSDAFPGHDASVILTGHREDLLALLDQARTAVEHAPEPLPPSPAEQAEAEAEAATR